MNYNRMPDGKDFELKPFNIQPTLYSPNVQANYAPQFVQTGKVTYREPQKATPILMNPAYGITTVPPMQAYTVLTNAQYYPTKPFIDQEQVKQATYHSGPIAQQQPQKIPDYNPSFMYYPNQGMKPIDDSMKNNFSSNNSSNQTIISKSAYQRKNYYNEKLPESWSRTPISGIYKDGSVEFDDYDEKLKDMFFTPELDEIKIWHTNDYLWGIQIIYREPWGKDKACFKGNPHYGKNQSPNNFLLSSLKLNYDDNIVEIRVNEGSIITGLYIKTFLGKELKVGKSDNLGDNLVQPLTKAVAIGGSYNNFCLENLYFYLN